jgi:NADPH-dependent glutamate synthase beta subunit-like oxidoreductase
LLCFFHFSSCGVFALPEIDLKPPYFFSRSNPVDLNGLDDDFLSYLKKSHALDLYDYILAHRAGETTVDKSQSIHMIALAEALTFFLMEKSGMQSIMQQQQDRWTHFDFIFYFKKEYVTMSSSRISRLKQEPKDFLTCHNQLKVFLEKHFPSLDLADERALAHFARDIDQQSTQGAMLHEQVLDWCALAQSDPEGKAWVSAWTSFNLPEKTDYSDLVAYEQETKGYLKSSPTTRHHREGFEHTHTAKQLIEIQSEADYCVYCHTKETDFCRSGFPVKKKEPESGFRYNPLNERLTGCPIDESISEMNWLVNQGNPFAAFIMIMKDNPLCALTGDRICNDCMKSCIYQKHDPVDIPAVESAVVKEVLSMPWGVEWYDLLMRWHPLRADQYLPKAPTGKRVLVMGMGPAGLTLSHHLWMAGCTVVGMDGLSIAPFETDALHEPVLDFARFCASLEPWAGSGFGGVASYGITARWDKRFLQLLMLCFYRRERFSVFGNMRLGGNILIEDAWSLGFDHLALALGAGLPSALNIPNSMAPGMRQANDFLMALHLTRAFRDDSIAALQVRLPALVIGGGLTACDTATELRAYYVTHVLQIAARYADLARRFSVEQIQSAFEPKDWSDLKEIQDHARLIIAAKAKGDPQFLNRLLDEWGGVAIVYRKRMKDSPAYRLNHQELQHALSEGVNFYEGLQPVSVALDESGAVSGLHCVRMNQLSEDNWQEDQADKKLLYARSIWVATGAKPNVAYAYEHRGALAKDGLHYQQQVFHQGFLYPHHLPGHCKSTQFGPFTNYDKFGKKVSFLGDMHPYFEGSVVKAMASGKRSYPLIVQALEADSYADVLNRSSNDSFLDDLQDRASTRIVAIGPWSAADEGNPLQTTSVMLMQVKAPLAARHALPGHLFRVQTMPSAAVPWFTQAAVLDVYEVDAQRGLLSFLWVVNSPEKQLLANLSAGDALSLMGPSGVRCKIPDQPERVLLCVDAEALSEGLCVGRAMLQAGHAVQLGFFGPSALANSVRTAWDAWGSDGVYITNLSVDGGYAHALRGLMMGHPPGALWDRVLLLASPPLIQAFCGIKRAMAGHLKPDAAVIARATGPMQCLLKGVCAQCLQWQVDPKTGRRTKAVYACSWQDQPVELLDQTHLSQRQRQDRMQRRLNTLWLRGCA